MALLNPTTVREGTFDENLSKAASLYKLYIL